MEHKQELGHKEPVHHHHHHHYEPTTTTTTLSSSSTTIQSSDPMTTSDSNNNGNAAINNNTVIQKEEEEEDVSFFHDFVAGGVAGSASVIVGHPLDSIKVRIQTAASSGGTKGGSPSATSLSSLVSGYGGVSSLFRGMSAPLSTACIINAIIFSSYGWSSRLYDEYFPPSQLQPLHTSQSVSANNTTAAMTTTEQQQQQQQQAHDSSLKAFTCGSFAGLIQALVICPQEHVKCRLQVQHGKGSADNIFNGPIHAARTIVQQHGMSHGLYRGWWITTWREVPAFGAYFAFYDLFKDRINAYFVQRDEQLRKDEQQQQQQRQHIDLTTSSSSSSDTTYSNVNVIATDDNSGSLTMAHHTHTWISSALAGGLTGALTWAMVYPFDVIKTRIQTMPLNTPLKDRRIMAVTQSIVQQYGWRHLFRGLGVTCFRAFPVNGIIFPVYEYTLMQVCALEY